MSSVTRHVPVMLNEVLRYLSCADLQDGQPALMLDCTVGGGGHTEVLLLDNPNLLAVAFDKDVAALERAKKRLGELADRVFFIHNDFRNIKDSLNKFQAEIAEFVGRRSEGEVREQLLRFPRIRFNRILIDLGISSDQLDDSNRGFSFLKEGPLDMRLNTEDKLTADEVVNNFSFAKLKSVFRRGGVAESPAKFLAEAIVKKRPLKTTFELRDICEEVLNRVSGRGGFQTRPAGYVEGKTSKHLAAVPFQAIRIAVNDEFAAINEVLDSVLEFLAPQGKLAVISFHSLEDELVAKTMRKWARPAQAPRGLAVNNSSACGRLLTQKAVLPEESEVRVNSRSRSARLRVFEKI